MPNALRASRFAADTQSLNRDIVRFSQGLTAQPRGDDAPRGVPKPLTDDVVRAADAVVTIGCGDACPQRREGVNTLPGRRRVSPVGTIYYAETPISLDDRVLAHLKAVIATKLRRDESFTVSWRHFADEPRGRSTIWLHPSIPLRFEFDDSEPIALDPRWIERLASSAHSTGGIVLVPAPDEADSTA